MTALNPGVSCQDCSNCLMADFGYSNYTVEGTTVVCMGGAHPDREFDRFYGEDERLLFARECPMFHPGGAHELDVDHEDLHLLPRHVRDYVESYGGKAAPDA